MHPFKEGRTEDFVGTNTRLVVATDYHSMTIPDLEHSEHSGPKQFAGTFDHIARAGQQSSSDIRWRVNFLRSITN